MQKMLRSKKGISPILATLLLIVIAVAAIVVTYAWVMTFIGAQTSSGSVLLDIENVSWNLTTSMTSIVVKNIGTSEAKIVRLYIGTTAANLIEVTAYSDLSPGKLLPLDQTLTVVLNWPNSLGSSWEIGRMYYFKIAPEVGTPKDFTWRASS